MPKLGTGVGRLGAREEASVNHWDQLPEREGGHRALELVPWVGTARQPWLRSTVPTSRVKTAAS